MRRHPILLRQKTQISLSWFSASWQWHSCVTCQYGQNGRACRLSILCHKLFIICGSFNDAVSFSMSNSSWPNLKYSSHLSERPEETHRNLNLHRRSRCRTVRGTSRIPNRSDSQCHAIVKCQDVSASRPEQRICQKPSRNMRGSEGT